MRTHAIIGVGLLVAAVALPTAVNAIEEEACPPLYSGQWKGPWHSNVFPFEGDLEGAIIADVDTHTLTGSFEITGDFERTYTAELSVDCGAVTGTAVTNLNEEADITGTVFEDGRALGLHYDTGSDNGEYVIEISAADFALAIGNVEMWGSDQPEDSESSARTAAAAAVVPKPEKRTVVVPLTLSEPMSKRVDISYRIESGTARPGYDYIDNGTVHRTSVAAGRTQAVIKVTVLTRSGEDLGGDRTIRVRILATSNSNIVPFDNVGEVSIQDSTH